MSTVSDVYLISQPIQKSNRQFTLTETQLSLLDQSSQGICPQNKLGLDSAAVSFHACFSYFKELVGVLLKASFSMLVQLKEESSMEQFSQGCFLNS